MFEVLLTRLTGDSHIDGIPLDVIRRRIDYAATELTHRFGNNGSRIAIDLCSAEMAAVAFLAVACSGNIAVPANLAADGDGLLSGAGCVALIRGVGHGCADIGHDLGLPVIPFDDLIKRRAVVDLVIPNKEAACCVLCTSGSLGRRVMHAKTVRNLEVELAELAERLDVVEQDCFVCNVPLSHLYGLIWSLLLPLYCGSSIISKVGGSARWLLASAHRHRASVVCSVPLFFRHICELKKVDHRACLGSVRHYISSADRLPAPVADRFCELTGSQITSIYGMTETGALFIAPNQPRNDLGTCMSYVDAKLDQGRLWVKGPNLLNPERWFDTGDVVHLQKGQFIYVGRFKLVVKNGGRSVYLGEIERVLLSSGVVQDVKLDRAEDLVHGEVVIASVVPNCAPGLALEALRRACQEKLPLFARPRRWNVVTEIKRTTQGKVL